MSPSLFRATISLWRAGVASAISVHDFYVAVGAGSQTAVLVHNCPDSVPDEWGEGQPNQRESDNGGRTHRILGTESESIKATPTLRSHHSRLIMSLSEVAGRFLVRMGHRSRDPWPTILRDTFR